MEGGPLLARCVNSRRRSNSVAFGAKRTFSELRLLHRPRYLKLGESHRL